MRELYKPAQESCSLNNLWEHENMVSLLGSITVRSDTYYIHGGCEDLRVRGLMVAGASMGNYAPLHRLLAAE